MGEGNRFRILVVDDDEALLGAVTRILIELGHEVLSASSAQRGLELVAEGMFDFIFLDYKMPEHDGAWFLRNAKVPRKTKVLLSTALAQKSVLQEMFKLGACGYLIKPYDERDIIKNLEFHSSTRTLE